MTVGMKSFSVPFIGGVSKHEALISSGEVRLRFINVNRVGNLLGLSLNVLDDVTGVASEADFV